MSSASSMPHAAMIGGASVEPWPSASYAWYVAVLLALAYVVSYVDRIMLVMLIGPIRTGLAISDTGISILIGFSFALFYATMGIPLGRLADHGNRSKLVVAGIAVWSVMTMASGLASTYGELLIARIGVAVGEAALSPAALSLLADYFPPQHRTRAIGLFLMGGNVGGTGGFILGAGLISLAQLWQGAVWPVVGSLEYWQIAFVLAGAPGLLLALIMLSIREPARRHAGTDAGGAVAKLGSKVKFSRVLAYLWQHRRAFAALFIGVTLALIVNFGYISWGVTMLSRLHGWSTAHAGVVFGSTALVAGVLAPIVAGALGSALTRRGYRDGLMRAALILAIIALAPLAVGPLLANPYAAVVVFMFGIMCTVGMTVLAQIAIQNVVPNQMRGAVTAIYYLTVNIIGLGLGPTLVALFTQFVLRDPAKLNITLSILSIVVLPVSIWVLARGLAAFRSVVEQSAAAEAHLLQNLRNGG